MYIIVKCNVRENHQYLRCTCQWKFERIRTELKRLQYLYWENNLFNSWKYNHSLPFRRQFRIDQNNFSFMKLYSLLLNLFSKIRDLLK